MERKYFDIDDVTVLAYKMFNKGYILAMKNAYDRLSKDSDFPTDKEIREHFSKKFFEALEEIDNNGNKLSGTSCD